LTFYEVDHIIPLFRGGSNCKDNVVPACFECNRQKGYKFVFEWLRQSKCRAKRRLDNISPGKYSKILNDFKQENEK
jgi:5-methylcytosine-specific restriction endonuclease McrA